MGAVLQLTTTLELLTCGECGMQFGVPQHWLNARREEKENDGKFTCPNGHGRQFRDTEVDRLKRQLETKERELEAERRRQQLLKNELHGAKVAEGKAKSALSRAHQRSRGGLCPCCKRSFENVRRHMATKHPEFGKVPET